MALQLATAGGGRYRLRQNAEINVTPFVDVMLVLLIIFMVAMPLSTTSLQLDLPKAQVPTTPVAPPVVVNVRPDGGIFIGERATTLSALPDQLALAVGTAHPKAQRVYIRGGKGLRYAGFMSVMDRLKASGFTQIGLINEEVR
jgi:biopolymer transport protein ExbD